MQCPLPGTEFMMWPECSWRLEGQEDEMYNQPKAEGDPETDSARRMLVPQESMVIRPKSVSLIKQDTCTFPYLNFEREKTKTETSIKDGETLASFFCDKNNSSEARTFFCAKSKSSTKKKCKAELPQP